MRLRVGVLGGKSIGSIKASLEIREALSRINFF